MPIGVQRSVRELGPVVRDYIASSVEKMDILPVGVKRKMIIDSMTEVHEDLRGDTRPPSQKETTKLYSNHFIKIQGNYFNRWANEAEERMDG